MTLGCQESAKEVEMSANSALPFFTVRESFVSTRSSKSLCLLEGSTLVVVN